MSLETDLLGSISQIPGVGQARADQFKKLGVETVEDLILFTPREYIDYSVISKIEDLEPGNVTIQAQLAQAPRSWRKGRRHMTEVVFEDETGKVKAMFFNQPYRSKQLSMNQDYVISGELGFFGRSYSMSQPSVERVESNRLSAGVVVAKYPQTKGLNSRMIRSVQQKALDNLSADFEIYPEEFVKTNDLMNLKDALLNIHFPESAEVNKEAENRLSFDEIFALQLSSRQAKDELSKDEALKIKFDEDAAKEFVSSLPFKLTDDQRKSAWEILKDLDSDTPMNRLLEGDVGTGKTVVAAFMAYIAAKNNMQMAFLAPTTILAEQHYKTLTDVLKGLGVNVAILNRHTKTKEKQAVEEGIRSGEIDLLVGTHAILGDGIKFKTLAAVVIDEQHRFGVDDRAKLVKVSKHVPHVLTMTATPIPRSLALTLYGELDISIIRELPKGRLPIDTKVMASAAKLSAYENLIEEVNKGNQAYIVVPRIEDFEDGTSSIESMKKELPKLIGKDTRFNFVHGRMKAEEKEKAMEEFYTGKVQVLLGTTVVEVGVDNPNATVMVVEGAERFGLAQLHQLRGRIGRSDKSSTCFLVTSTGIEPTRRLHAMQQTQDGFKLSALDLEIRGPGALYGTRQHGALDLNIADISDSKLLAKVSKAVDEFVEKGYDTRDFPLLNRRVAAMRKTSFLN